MKTRDIFTADQNRAVEWLKARPLDDEGKLLWAGMGTGKTVSMLTATDELRREFYVNKMLVVAPRLVAERVWSDEVKEWEHLKHLRVSRIVGTPQQRMDAIRRDADIYTISRDNVAWLEDQFIRITKIDEKSGKVYREQYNRWPWDTVVLDESQSFKNQEAKRYKSMRRLRRLVKRLYEQTGSFIPNGYEDAWAQVYLLDGGARLGLTEKAYHQRWFAKEILDGTVVWDTKRGADIEIDRRLSDITLVMRDAQPPAERNFVRVSLSKDELAAYRKMVRTSVLEVAGHEINAVNAGVLYGKLLQLANGAIYTPEGQWVELHKKKLEALWELLESLPKPVIIGYGFVHDIERIFANAPRDLGRFAVLKSGKSLDAWRRGEIDYGIMHPASAGHGLNDLYVSGAENLIWFGFTSNLEFYEQLNARLTGGHRRQGRNVVIHHIVAEDTIDERAIELLDFKGKQQSTAQIRIAQDFREAACQDRAASSKISARSQP